MQHQWMVFIAYYVLNRILLVYLEACAHISPDPDIDRAMMLLIPDIPSHDLPGLNVKR